MQADLGLRKNLLAIGLNDLGATDPDLKSSERKINTFHHNSQLRTK
jgi:hypothetical protein